jgi:hypothetical protein
MLLSDLGANVQASTLEMFMNQFGKVEETVNAIFDDIW